MNWPRGRRWKRFYEDSVAARLPNRANTLAGAAAQYSDRLRRPTFRANLTPQPRLLAWSDRLRKWILRGARRRVAAPNAVGHRPRTAFHVSVWAALIAILFQAFVVQSHVHRPAGVVIQAAAATVASDLAAPIDLITQGQARQDCVLCLALAGSGRAVLAASPAIAPPEGESDVILTASRTQGPVYRAHSWQSRAPPASLKA